MEEIAKIPEWLGTAIVGAVFAVIGFFAKNLWEWLCKRHESSRQRHARLEHLDRLLDESGNLFRSQRAQAQRLLESLERSQPAIIDPDLSLDQIFSRGFARLSSDEAQLHAIIRGVTATAMKRVNADMSNWLRDDDYFKQSKSRDDQHNRLAHKLQDLELHLNEWHANLSALFETDQTLALNYLADEQEKGTGFPVSIESAVKQALRIRSG